MSLTIDECRYKLIDKILFAYSQDEVKRYIETAMKGLQEHKVNGHIIARFVEKTAQHLEEFSPMSHNAQQWSNIKMARIQFHHIKRYMQEKEHH